jgi:hypothetical protein
VAPWQLFFQQSNVIDKRLTSRWIKHEQLDTIIGSFITNITAGGLIVAAAFVFTGTKFNNNFVDVLTSAKAMKELGYANMGTLVAIILLNASIVGACAVTLSTSYAFGDTFKVRHSLHRKLSEAKVFYGSYAALVAAAGTIVLIPNAPLGLMTLAVQALAGILLPSATVFLVLLCNDRAVLGPWVNSFWLNAVASIIVGVLVILSLILATTTFFTLSDADTIKLSIGLGIALVVVLMGMGILLLVQHMRKGTDPEKVVLSRIEKEAWQMPPLAELPKPTWSVTRKVGMFTLRLYLIIAVILMVIKVVQLAMGH